MPTGWWKLKENLDPLKCLLFPKELGNVDDENSDYDTELFNEIIESNIPLNEIDIEHIIGLVKQGYYQGQVVQE